MLNGVTAVKSCKMGLITSREQTMLDGPVAATTKSHHARQASTRTRTKPPMPDRDELESRFIKVLVSAAFSYLGNDDRICFVYKHNDRSCCKPLLLRNGNRLLSNPKLSAARDTKYLVEESS